MNIAITGASGFLGPHLIARLLKDGHSIRTLGRRDTGIAGVRHFAWDATAGEPSPDSLEGVEAVVNLIGEPVAQRWNSEVKRRIRESRGKGTRNLVSGLARLAVKPRVFVGGSAVGFYGDRGDELLTENSSAGQDFLAQVCLEWEEASQGAAKLGMRVVVLRTGIVLGADGGALAQMATPFKAGVGGPVGSGKQWVPWIHVDDWVELVLFALANEPVKGPVNAVASNPVRNADFAHALGSALSRPSLLPVPVFALKLLYGEAANALVSSQRALPTVATRAGFQFRYPEVAGALNQIYKG
ncbi:MAG: TIGR01777 family oxidoreductase [Bryobacteraceae bacterium]|nr:TIGR01777 family oxidoreductase [Bryobacteraceae bacterium]